MAAGVAVVEVEGGRLYEAVRRVFDLTVPGGELVKSSGEVYVKPNGVDFRPYSFTAPEVLEAVIRYFYDEADADRVYVMENSTQGNITRVVFAFTGYEEVCRRTGAKPLYLDEQPQEEVELPHFEEPVRLPRVVMEKLVRQRESYTYVNLPKLKTHSMAVVSLGVKNQLGLMAHRDRRLHHNNRLHQRLADLLSVVRPDYTLIDGLYAIAHGHYPLKAFLDRQVHPMNLLIGGSDALAVDVVGARVLGYRLEEVQHLRLASEQGLGRGDLNRIRVAGVDLSRFTQRLPYQLVDQFPEDVVILRGREQLCPEGCELNVLMVLQMLAYDHGGRGGFTILMGRGFDEEQLDSIDTPVFIAGDCAIAETRERLVQRLGRKRVHLSPTCNSLADTVSALGKLMGVKTLDLVPSRRKAVLRLLQAKLHRSTALTPKLF